MRKTIHKWFFVWDFDKEEKWLNEMAAKGLSLVSVGFCKYEFEDTNPGEYKICLQLLDGSPKNAENQKYMEFLEETGAEHVGTFSHWVYFRKKASEGDFNIYSDNESRVKYLSRIFGFTAFVTGLNLYVGVFNIFLAIINSMPFNYIGLINLAIALVGIFGTVKLWKKRKRIKDEGQIFE